MGSSMVLTCIIKNGYVTINPTEWENKDVNEQVSFEISPHNLRVFNLTTQVSSGLVVADFSVCFCSIVLHTSHLLGKALLLSSIPSPREVLNICVPLGDERQVTQSDQRRTWTALSPNWLCGFIYCCCTFLIQSPSTIIQRVQIHG